MIKKREIENRIFVLEFDNQKEMASTFLRFQEHYESPKFAKKIFTHKEFKEWYKKENEGKFTYHTDWRGFNIPSYILKKFYQGKFNPLTKNEKKLLSLFKEHKGEFYIVAHKGNPSGKSLILKHEIAHGLFYTNKNYRREIMKIIKKYDLRKLRNGLLSLGDYNKNILDDEIQAYSISLSHTLRNEFPHEFPDEMKKEIRKAFHKYTGRD